MQGELEAVRLREDEGEGDTLREIEGLALVVGEALDEPGVTLLLAEMLALALGEREMQAHTVLGKAPVHTTVPKQGVCESEGVSEGDARTLAERLLVAEPVRVRTGVTDSPVVAERERDGLRVVLALREKLREALRLRLPVSEADALPLPLAESEGDTLAVSERVAQTLAEAATLGVTDGVRLLLGVMLYETQTHS